MLNEALIADATLLERVLHQLTILTICIGVLRVWILEAAKRENLSAESG